MSKAPKSLEPSDILIEHFPDRSIRRLFQDPEYVRGLVEIIAPDLVGFLDFSRGTQQNRSFISDALRERESDVLLRVPFQRTTENEELLIYILIEHQSTVDPTMGFRMLSYMMEIWQGQWREWQSEAGSRRRLDPILPIIFYTGDRRWTSPLSLTAIMEVPEILERFVPTFDTLFLEVKTADRETLTKPGHPLGWLLSVLQKERSGKSALSEALASAVSALSRLDEAQVSQVRPALLYFIQLILHRRSAEEREELIELVKRHSQDESEVVIMAQTAAEFLIEQGKAEGIIEGKQAAILQLLRIRFQNVPETLSDRITSIQNLSHLDTLLERVMTAQSLEDIQG
ncbi:hypothetical protein F4Y59_04795 [Candidatus Poribacteria bacterium]|nr:hypothetical protein [Candidatus Poribacteria bacterium]MYK19126.1 hypothetical protein [Candidatus Poribacteria bacterium]